MKALMEETARLTAELERLERDIERAPAQPILFQGKPAGDGAVPPERADRRPSGDGATGSEAAAFAPGTDGAAAKDGASPHARDGS